MELCIFLLHPLMRCSSLSFPPSPDFLSMYKNVFQLKTSCWPALSFLLFAVPYNYIGSVSRQIEWSSSSLWLCAALTDRWASQLIPSLVFVELWNVCRWWTRPSAALLFARSRLCFPPLGWLVDPRLFKVIRVTVRKINRLLMLPLLPRLLLPFLTALYKVFLYVLMGRTLFGSINQIINGL